MSLTEFAADTGHTIEAGGTAQPAETQFGAIALDRIALSATNPRTTHGRTRLLQLLDDRDQIMLLGGLLDDDSDEARADLANVLGSVKLAEFVSSVHQHGVNQPILLRPLPAERLADTQPEHPGQRRPEYELVAGERRYLASRLAGKATVPAMVKAMTDQEVLEFQLVENLQREGLTPLEEAEGYARLCDQTGIGKEAIGAKIGKSRSYVYQRLKLLDLCHEARLALSEGQLDASRALLIARVPDQKLQIKALAEATRVQSWNGQPPSVREFERWLQTNVMLRLERAPFPVAVTTLVEGAGACKDCHKRTGAHPELFADVDSADVCTDPKCYDAKTVAHQAAVRAEAEASGLKVIDGKEAKQVVPYAGARPVGYLDLDEPAPGSDSAKPLRKVLGKDAPEATVLIDPHTGQARHMVPTAAAGEVLAKKGVTSTVRNPKADAEADAKFEAEQAANRERRAIAEATNLRAVNEISASIRSGIPCSFSAEVLRPMLAKVLDWGSDHVAFDPATLCRLWSLPTPEGRAEYELVEDCERHVQAAPDTDLGGMLLQVLLCVDLESTDPPVFLPQLARETAVDVAAIEREVKAERKAAEKEAAAATKKAKKAPAATLRAARAEGEPEGEPAAASAAASPAAGKKARGKAAQLSAHAAKQGIADAMQDLEPASGVNALEIGEAVTFKQDLKVDGKLRKLRGKTGTVEGKVGDRAWRVCVGGKVDDVVVADYTELQVGTDNADGKGEDDQVDAAPTAEKQLDPLQAWPFPKSRY